MNDHQDVVIVTTPRCPLCGATGTVRVALVELQAWLDADGKMPIMAGFRSLSADDHIRLVTGIHSDCPKTPALAGTDDGIRGDAPGAFGEG